MEKPVETNIDLLDDENVLRTIAVTLMQIRDYLAVSLAFEDRSSANTLETIHSQGKIFLQPPVLFDSSVEVKVDGTDD